MKFLDEKGRLFGKVNIVDFLVVISLLLAMTAFAVALFATPIKEAVAPTVKMTSVFRVRGASIYLQEEIDAQSLLGEQLIAGNVYVNAFVTDIYSEPYTTQVTTADGRIVDATDPTKVDYIITVESEITANTPILKIGTQEVRAGRTFIFKTRTFEITANIESVRVDD
ncbi:MAG: DUF4330 domain-containing protein [Clostridia bacterium]